jgi:hypothetical protein
MAISHRLTKTVAFAWVAIDDRDNGDQQRHKQVEDKRPGHRRLQRLVVVVMNFPK